MIHPDEPLTIVQAAKHYPKGTHVSTIIRHITRGIKTPRGIVRLEAYRIGKRWTTTLAAIERFRVACTDCYLDAPPPAMCRSASQARAAAYLDSIGLR